MKEYLSELFFLQAAFILAKDIVETKTIFENLLTRWNNGDLDLMDLEPRTRKAFLFYHKYQDLIC